MFVAMLILGGFIADDFTPHVDGFVQRQHSLVNYEYINRVLLNRYIPELEAMIPSTLENYPESSRAYGVFLQLPLVIIEDATGFTMLAYRVYQIRMYYSYTFFVFGLLCLYLMMKGLFQSRLWSVIGVLFIYTFPLYFGSAFTNIKDLLFASLFMISSYFMMRLLKKHSAWNILLFAFFSAITTGIRIIGILLPGAAICMLLYEAVYRLLSAPKLAKPEQTKHMLQIIGLCAILYCMVLVALYIITPAAWTNPIRHFKNVFGFAADYKWDSALKYQGYLVKWEDIPWNYLLRMLRISIPWFVGINFLLGLVMIAKNVWFGQGFFRKVYDHRYIGLQAILFLVPVSYQVLKHVKIYGGWRHMYFVYVPLVVVAVYGLMQIAAWLKRFKSPVLLNLAILCSALSITLNGYHTAATHPYQDNSFNYPSVSLASDYLVAGRSAIPDAAKYLLEQFPEKTLLTNYPKPYCAMLTEEENQRILIVTDEETPDFYFETYRTKATFYPPKEGYIIYHNIVIDGYPILTVYIRDGYQ
jgi:hypothetical protein